MSRADLPIRAKAALRFPLKSQLRDPVRPGALDRIWRAVDDAAIPQTRRGHGWRLSIAASLVLGVGLVWFAFQGRTSPLLLESGDAFSWVAVPSEGAPRLLRFEDGSSVAVEPGSELKSMASTAANVVLSLQRGRARLSVVPGGQRRWTVETAHGQIRVLGTEFIVETSPGTLRVEVFRGLVQVNSTLLSDSRRELAAGERLLLSTTATAVQDGAAPPERVEADPLPPSGTGAALAVPVPRIDNSVLERKPANVQRGVADTPSIPERASTRSAVAELMSQADEARLQQRFERANQLLHQVVRDYPNDGRASLAAFTRGVLQLQQLGQATEARKSFQQALSLGASASLREDCYLRWFEAELQLGQRTAAIEVAKRYRQSFTRGRHLGEISRQLDASGVTAE